MYKEIKFITNFVFYFILLKLVPYILYLNISFEQPEKARM